MRKTDVTKGVDGKPWILGNREKTESITNIPLLPQAMDIIDRYADYPPCASRGLALPVLSNRKMNSYLKEIADLCGITKKPDFPSGTSHLFPLPVWVSNRQYFRSTVTSTVCNGPSLGTSAW